MRIVLDSLWPREKASSPSSIVSTSTTEASPRDSWARRARWLGALARNKSVKRTSRRLHDWLSSESLLGNSSEQTKAVRSQRDTGDYGFLEFYAQGGRRGTGARAVSEVRHEADDLPHIPVGLSRRASYASSAEFYPGGYGSCSLPRELGAISYQAGSGTATAKSLATCGKYRPRRVEEGGGKELSSCEQAEWSCAGKKDASDRRSQQHHRSRHEGSTKDLPTNNRSFDAGGYDQNTSYPRVQVSRRPSLLTQRPPSQAVPVDSARYCSLLGTPPSVIPPPPARPPPPVPLTSGVLCSPPHRHAGPPPAPPRTTRGLFRSLSISGHLNDGPGAIFARNSTVRRSRSRDDLRLGNNIGERFVDQRANRLRTRFGLDTEKTVYHYPPNGAYRTPVILVPRVPSAEQQAAHARSRSTGALSVASCGTLRAKTGSSDGLASTGSSSGTPRSTETPSSAHQSSSGTSRSAAHDRKSRSLCTLLEEHSSVIGSNKLPPPTFEDELSPLTSVEVSKPDFVTPAPMTDYNNISAHKVEKPRGKPQVYYLLDDYLTPVKSGQSFSQSYSKEMTSSTGQSTTSRDDFVSGRQEASDVADVIGPERPHVASFSSPSPESPESHRDQDNWTKQGLGAGSWSHQRLSRPATPPYALLRDQLRTGRVPKDRSRRRTIEPGDWRVWSRGDQDTPPATKSSPPEYAHDTDVKSIPSIADKTKTGGYLVGPRITPEIQLEDSAQLFTADPRQREVERIRATYRARLERLRQLPRPPPAGTKSWHEANPLPAPAARRQALRWPHELSSDCPCQHCVRATGEKDASLKSRSHSDPRRASSLESYRNVRAEAGRSEGEAHLPAASSHHRPNGHVRNNEGGRGPSQSSSPREGGGGSDTPRGLEEGTAAPEDQARTDPHGRLLPLSPADAVQFYGSYLTEYELAEIDQYEEIWFLGLGAKKVAGDEARQPNAGYDDEHGSYIKTPHDHIAYRYEILEVIGRGSFGQVIRTLDHKTNTQVAIKLIRNKKRFHQQALVEVSILDYLRRRDKDGSYNIIHMLDYFYFRSHLCVTFQLMGLNLFELIKKNNYQGLSLSLIRKFCSSIVQCLRLLAKEGIIHCDLKPENVLLKSRNSSNIKIIDFGSSCYSHQRVYTYIQSRFYRSPEVILGLPYGTPIDMWSLGCILVELHTGFPLFPGENEVEQLACIMEVLDLPPEELARHASRRRLFFDSRGTPRTLTNTKGRRRRPGSKSLTAVLKTADATFADFVGRCLTWDPTRRLTPEEAARHPFVSSRPGPPLPPPPAASWREEPPGRGTLSLSRAVPQAAAAGARSEPARSDPTRSESTRSEVVWTEASRLGSGRSDSARAEGPRLRGARSDTARSDVVRSDRTRSDGSSGPVARATGQQVLRSDLVPPPDPGQTANGACLPPIH